MVIKLPHDVLNRYVLTRTGTKDPSVIVGPAIGEDAAVIELDYGNFLVAHVDPIIGAISTMGWLAVNVVSNDIAVRGVRPRWLLSDIFLPEGSSAELLDRLTSQIDEAAKEIGVMIVGGHSGFAPGLERPLISMTAIGVAEGGKFVTTSGARDEDLVIMTKAAGIEGTAILATDFRKELLKKGVSEEILKRAESFLRRVSIIKEALALSGIASAMHDPTNGGVIEGLAEIAYASKKTIEVWENSIPVAQETSAIARALGLNPLKLISSGALIATVPESKKDEALIKLSGLGLTGSVIGKVRESAGSYVKLHKNDGSAEEVQDVYVRDELDQVWEKLGKDVVHTPPSQNPTLESQGSPRK
ncbi:MAG: AIR synthase family protein [Thermoprotei archaeon]